MGMSELRLGTSSWIAEGWVGSFYPDGCKTQDFLPFYASRFDAVEVDSTFYRIPTPQTAKQWKERTPEGFLFAAKVPQVITHQKVLIDAEGDLKNFLSVINLLGDRLGPLLLQFPYMNKQKFRSLGFFLERLEPFLEQLSKNYQWAVEVRNKGWLSEKLYAVLRRYRVALALVDHVWMPRPRELFDTGDPVTADFSYIRWLGDRKGIEEQTKVWDKVIIDRTEELREWVRIMRQLQQRGLRIFAFMNNHFAGFAPASVDLFRELWDQNQPASKRTFRPHRSDNLEFSF